MTTNKYKKAYGQYIQNQRHVQKVSQESLAYTIGISSEALGRIERGINFPKFTTSLLLEEELHLDHHYIKELLHNPDKSES